MEHTEEYLQAKWVTENPKGYDERDVARADSYCKAYLDGYNQALSIANVSKRHLIEDILERMDGVFPDYHYDIVKDYLDDDC